MRNILYLAELLLCMAVSHALIRNPFFGAAVFLFWDIVKTVLLYHPARVRRSDGRSYYSWILVPLVAVAGLAVVLLYPLAMKEPLANAVSFVCLSLVLADFVARARSLRLKGRAAPGLTFGDIASYRVFSNMNLYAAIALNLGGLMCFCRFLVPLGDYDPGPYLGAAVWVLLTGAVYAIFLYVIRRRKISLGFGAFMAGALVWILGDVLMLRASSSLAITGWTLVWGVGIALLSAGIAIYQRGFEAVALLSGDKSREDLEKNQALVSMTSTIISSIVMLVVMALWTFLVPGVHDGHLPAVLRICMMQLPLAAMVAAVFFALNQPMDGRVYDKLMTFLDGDASDSRVRDSLRDVLVKKYRVRYGVKIISALLRPFLRLKVSGRENLSPGSYPSVFVCNHGFINGPVAAVIYLPTFFRPWIHDVMLDEETTIKEMRFSFPHLPMPLLRLMVKATCWALNSYDPVPVARGTSRDVFITFDRSLSALEDGDNLLIFPEKPHARTRHAETGVSEDEQLRGFYTGFAHLGKMYWDRTGKQLLFYPLYADVRKRRFCIGSPVSYDSALGAKESKAVIASRLHAQMQELSGRDDW